MIFGNIDNLKYEKNYHVIIQKATNYLKKTDFTKMEVGRFHPFGEIDMFVQVIDLETKKEEEIMPEIHKKYIDIQFLVKGEERIGVSVDNGKNKISENYNSERDILFYSESINEFYIKMIQGTFAVFFPNIIHRPGCLINEKMMIRKVVIKINVELLNSIN
ncbi:MAG: YhcH/YjgK/YiaL family protein [Fusobacteriaceae bacterium]